MVQLHNFSFSLLPWLCLVARQHPYYSKCFVNKDVPTSAPSSDGTIIPIPILLLPLLVYLHSKKFIHSMDKAKSGVLVKANHLILLSNIIGRSSSETRARNTSFHFVPILHFLFLESKGDFSYSPFFLKSSNEEIIRMHGMNVLLNLVEI